MNLYEVNAELAALSEEEEVTEEMVGIAFSRTELSLREKAQQAQRWHLNLAAQAKAYREEAARLSKAAASFESKLTASKDWLRTQMQVHGVSKIEGTGFKISLVNNSVPTVQILDESQVPAAFKVERTMTVIDKKGIATHVKETGEIPNGTQVEIGQHVRFK